MSTVPPPSNDTKAADGALVHQSDGSPSRGEQAFALDEPPPEEMSTRPTLTFNERTLFFRELYEDAEQYAALLDDQGMICHANRRARASINRELDSFAGIHISNAHWLYENEAQKARLLEAVRNTKRGVSSHYETTYCTAQGTLHALRLHFRPVWQADGAYVGAVIEGWDVSQRVQAETSLEKTRQTLEAVLEQSPVAMVVVTASDRVVRYINRIATELLGCADEPSYCGMTVDEMMQRQSWRILSVDGSFVPHEERPLQRAIRGQIIHPVEQSVERKDGTRCWFVASGAPVFSTSGDVLAAVLVFRDISNERRLLAQLQDLSNEQHTILNTLRLGICLLKHRHIQWVNQAFLVCLAYTAEELKDADTSLFYAHREDYERVGRDGYAELARGGLYSTEVVLRNKDGKEFWASLQGQAINPAQLDEGTIWVWQDISEHKQQEDALRASERKLKEIFRASPEMIVVSSMTTGRFIEVNDAFSRLTGYTRAEALGRTSLEIGLWPTLEARTQIVEKAKTLGHLPSQEVQLRKRSGTLFDVMIAGASFTMSDEECLIWIISDITEYKQAQRAIREGEARFKRLVENSNDLIVMLDEQREIRSLVGPIDKIFGFEADEVMGRDELEFCHPDDRAMMKSAFDELLRHPEKKSVLEYRIRHKQGHYVHVESVGSNWLTEPAILGVVRNVREITERKSAEQERLRLQEQLQQALKMEAVGRLAGGVAHDFNNLLTVISGNLELARDEIKPVDPIADLLAEVAKAADSAATLTKQLLAFSRRQLIEPKVLNINELIANLQNMLRRLLGEDIDLRFHLAQDLGATRVDPGQFDQVIINLVVNARDAMPQGGSLDIETMNTDLDDLYCQNHPGAKPGEYVLLAVTDSGHGMTAEVKRLLFEPFFTTKPKGCGTGLGLAMIFGAVQQAGGTIDVYSEVNQGATFKLYLPRIAFTVDGLALQAAAAEAPLGHETVLLVEDEPSVRRLAATMLHRLGYVVLTASRGDEALKIARECSTPIELLMTDVVMPGMSGREVAEQLHQIHPETHVLLTSGYTEDVMIHHGVLSENISFISKPYTLRALALKLRQDLTQEPHDFARAPESR